VSGIDLMSYLLFGRIAGRIAAMQERDDAGALIRHRAAANASAARAELQRENEWLRTLVRALVAICLEKGLITEKELQERIAKIDADDAARAKAERATGRAKGRTPR
jgi:hypothetical protein